MATKKERRIVRNPVTESEVDKEPMAEVVSEVDKEPMAEEVSEVLATVQLKEPSAFGLRRAFAGIILFNDGPNMRRIKTDATKPITVTISQ